MKKDKYPNQKRDLPTDPFDSMFNNVFPWHRTRSPFILFDDFDKQFQRMEQHMNSLLDQYRKGELPPPEKGGPQIYGYTFRVGSDGKPHFEEFGNISQLPLYKQQEQLQHTREPLIDLQEGEHNITIDAELPGVSKKEIELEATADLLTINVNNPERSYYKEIHLPSEIDPDTADVTFNNGILSINLNKIKPSHSGKKLRIK